MINSSKEEEKTRRPDYARYAIQKLEAVSEMKDMLGRREHSS